MSNELKRDIVPSLQRLPFAREVQAWLIDFLSAATHKKNPPPDYTGHLQQRSSLFVDAQDIDRAIDFISVIYHEQGYMPPWELENRLIYAFDPRLPRDAMHIAKAFGSFEQARDQLTNFYQKPQTPLVMGLAALYQETQGQPVSAFEIDFSNMRGTNDFNDRIIKAAYPDLSVNDRQDMAMDLTDQYAFIVAHAILKAIEGNINQHQPHQHAHQPSGKPVQLVPLRTGGDEVRVIAVNLPAEEARSILMEVHGQIEAVTAMMGLHDHTHAKRPLDNLSNGFGAAGAIFPVVADGQLNDMLAAADHEIAARKVEIGRQRATYDVYNFLKPPGFNLDKIYSDSLAASRHLDHVHDAMMQLRTELEIPQKPGPAIDIAEYVAACHKLTHIPGKAEMREMIYDLFLASIQRRNIDLTPAQQKVLKIKVLKFPQDDPSSGALSSRDFPAMAGVSLQVIQNLQTLTAEPQTPWTMGVSFHNLSGLNETLGHGHSNLVLRAQANIVRESLHKAGIADQHFCLSHMGNGDFYAVVQPVYMDEGQIHTISATDMYQVSREIEARLEKLNATPIALFLQKHGITPPPGLPSHFGYIDNPREPHLPGLHASVSLKKYAADNTLNSHGFRQGGALKLFISEHLTATCTANKERWAAEARPVTPHNPGAPSLPLKS